MFFFLSIILSNFVLKCFHCCLSGRKMQVALSSYHIFRDRQSSFGFAHVKSYRGNQFEFLFERSNTRAGRLGFDIFNIKVINYQKGNYIVLYSCEDINSVFGRRAKENVWVLSRTWYQSQASLRNIDNSIKRYTRVPKSRLIAPQMGFVICPKIGF